MTLGDKTCEESSARSGVGALLFPGQGSQYVGMGKELYGAFKCARETFEEAEEAINYRISTLCFEGPLKSLNLTMITQPAILTVSVAALRVLRSETGICPTYVCGHSLGEYSALVAANAIDFADAVQIVRTRGAFMQEAVPVGEGAMAVVLGLQEEVVKSICDKASQGDIVSVANYNCAGQTVISGHLSAVTRAMRLAEEAGAKAASALPVSAPMHSPLMATAGKRLGEFLDGIKIRDACIPLVSNVDSQPHTEGREIKDLLVRHVSSPVRWEESMRTLLRESARKLVEIGPRKVLSGLAKRIHSGFEVGNVEDIESLTRTISLFECGK